jgi:hypothetical protein
VRRDFADTAAERKERRKESCPDSKRRSRIILPQDIISKLRHIDRLRSSFQSLVRRQGSPRNSVWSAGEKTSLDGGHPVLLARPRRRGARLLLVPPMAFLEQQSSRLGMYDCFADLFVFYAFRLAIFLCY